MYVNVSIYEYNILSWDPGPHKQLSLRSYFPFHEVTSEYKLCMPVRSFTMLRGFADKDFKKSCIVQLMLYTDTL
jgi:hypothetical protein